MARPAGRVREARGRPEPGQDPQRLETTRRALALLGSHRGNDREVLRADLGWVELADVRSHASEKLGHGHWRLLALLGRDPAHRIAARDDHLPKVRTLHAPLLARLHVNGDAIVHIHEAD